MLVTRSPHPERCRLPGGISPWYLVAVCFYLVVTRGGVPGEWWLPFETGSASVYQSRLVPICCGIVLLAVLIAVCTELIAEELRRGRDEPPRQQD